MMEPASTALQRALFQDASPTICSVTISSGWKNRLHKKEIELQTDPYTPPSKATQTKARQDQMIQTDEVSEDRPIANVANTLKSPAFREFLMRTIPLVELQLESNLLSHAFDGYDVSWDSHINTVVCILELEHRAQITAAEPSLVTSKGEVGITSLSWNSTGALLAAAYGRLDHDGWCSHTSVICVWPVFRRNIDPHKAPIALEVAGCLTCIAFHPTCPSLIAGGTYHGIVMVWDIARAGIEAATATVSTEGDGDPLLASSVPTDAGVHREPVARLAWIPTGQGAKQPYALASIGYDGKVLLWTVHENKKVVQPFRGYKLLSKRSKTSKGGAVIGGTDFSFSSEDRSVFVAATEPGRIHKCTLGAVDWSASAANSNAAARTGDAENDDEMSTGGEKSSMPFKNPITFAYEPHVGPAYGIDCSPFHRNIFLSCSSDSTIRLYNMLKAKPLLTLAPSGLPVYCVRWSPYRPLVFAAGGEDGQVYLYDLLQHRTMPVATLTHEKGNQHAYSPQRAAPAVETIEFNARVREVLASGDRWGRIRVWQTATHLALEQRGERDMLNRLGSMEGANADPKKHKMVAR